MVIKTMTTDKATYDFLKDLLKNIIKGDKLCMVNNHDHCLCCDCDDEEDCNCDDAEDCNCDDADLILKVIRASYP